MGACDFFVTYNHHDEPWATWMAEVLEGAGHLVRIQAWDFQAGGNFMVAMNDALAECKHAIGVLSPHYFRSGFTTAEWTAAYALAIQGRDRGFIPVLVEPCNIAPLLGPIAYVDLAGLAECEARNALLAAVSPLPPRVASAPFPGHP
jgi:hypothetical protein